MGNIQDENSKEGKLVLPTHDSYYDYNFDFLKTPGSVGFIGRKASKRNSVMKRRDLNLKMVKDVKYSIKTGFKNNLDIGDSRSSLQASTIQTGSVSPKTCKQQYILVNYEGQGGPLAPMDSFLDLDVLRCDKYTQASPLPNMLEIPCDPTRSSNECMLLSMLDQDCHILKNNVSNGLTQRWNDKIYSSLRLFHLSLPKISLFQGEEYNILKSLIGCRQ
ncbi:BA75_02355T0 [Komagataella pastoris]|uniref:BA75_02355T0 n=1 Tax=Komagataella pastoris TaxID=4922 RepID=A0A1B2JBV5_PICPA|nr:BA75_02355T0 [Komagataella pastoris]